MSDNPEGNNNSSHPHNEDPVVAQDLDNVDQSQEAIDNQDPQTQNNPIRINLEDIDAQDVEEVHEEDQPVPTNQDHMSNENGIQDVQDVQDVQDTQAPAIVTNGSDNPNPQDTAENPADVTNEDMVNSSGLPLPNVLANQFHTPLKDLPALKDIDPIETPKSFSVAKDAESSPLVQNVLPSLVQQHSENSNNNSHLEINMNQENSNFTIVASFLEVPESQISQLNQTILENIMKRAVEYSDLKSENSYLQLNMENSSQSQANKLKYLQDKLASTQDSLDQVLKEKEELSSNNFENERLIDSLRSEKSNLSTQLNEVKQSKEDLEKKQESEFSNNEKDIVQYNNNINNLMKENIDKTQKINMISKELNEVRNETFSVKFELTKSLNESSYLRKEKQWFEDEWKNCQERFTNLSKQYQSERLFRANEISELSSKLNGANTLNEKLDVTVKELQERTEAQATRLSESDSKYESDKIKLEREIKAKQDALEIIKVQATEANTRIQQLEDYINEIKQKSTESLESLDIELRQKTERVIELEEKVRRTEEALEKELREETDLPKLTQSAELIAANSNGISLSSLYAEFNHMKKQLVLERSHKEKLANQLDIFVKELEAKKPTILSYKEQIAFYETSMNDMIGKIEFVRLEKLESDKKANRLKAKVIECEDELVSMKKLSKDLGKQLCYYLIHSHIRESNEDPLTLAERNAIENILEKTGNNENSQESDTDKLISDRLVGFASIAELQHKNAELLTVTRQLGKKLEAQDNNSNNEIESVAINEAKEAILTLEGELDSLKAKYDAVEKERDVLKSLSKGERPTNNDGEARYLTEANNDLKKKINDYEEMLRRAQQESSVKTKELSEKLDHISSDRDELRIKINSMNHNVDLVDTRYNNCQITLENTRAELERIRESADFWKNQTSKQENLLVSRSNELKEAENKATNSQMTINSLQNENELLKSLHKTLEQDISQLRGDKSQLNEFVLGLQSLLRERETSNTEMNQRLNQSIQNYQSLQDKLSERDEKMQILANQSEMALKAQNSKLQQVNDLSYNLMQTKNRLDEKNSQVEALQKKVQQLLESLAKSEAHVKASQMNPASGTSSGNSVTSGSADTFEVEQAKHELKMAELQVSELSTIAKSAEDALVNVTSSFDEYKNENERIQNDLRQEKDKLANEINELKRESDKLRAEVSNKDLDHSREMQDLRLQLDSALAKANSYDSMEKSYEEKLKGVKNDLEVYAKLSDENQKKYNEELAKNDQNNREVTSLKEKNQELNEVVISIQGELANAKAQLEKSSDIANEEKAKVEDELSRQNSKLRDIQEQYNILLNQLELLKTPNESSETGGDIDELRQVVNYIRREKEVAESKVFSLTEEVQKVQFKLDATVLELKGTKAELQTSKDRVINVNDSANEHKKLLEQLQQMNILRESNTTLRSENENYVKEIQRIQIQIRTLENKVTPLEKDIKKLNDVIEEKDQSIRLLKDENDRLSTVSKANEEGTASSNEEDKKKLAELQARFDRLLNESRTKLQSSKNKQKDYQKLVDTLNGDVTRLNGELEEAKKAHEEAVNKIEKSSESPEDGKRFENEKKQLEEEVNKLKEKLNNSGETEQLEAKLNEVRNEFEQEKQKLTEKMKQEYEAQLQQVKQSENSDGEWKQKYTELESSIDNKKSELEAQYKERLEQEVKAKVDEQMKQMKQVNNGSDNENAIREQLNKEHQQKIDELKQKFSKELETEKDKVRGQTEKKFELKMKMLNKKIEKFENGGGDGSSTGDSNKSSAPNSSGSQNKPFTGLSGAFGINLQSGNQQQGSQQQAAQPFQQGSQPFQQKAQPFQPFQQKGAFQPSQPFQSQPFQPQPFQPQPLKPQTQEQQQNQQSRSSSQSPNKTQQQPLGHQFTESTLTVHKPTSSTEANQSAPTNQNTQANQNPNAQNKKRPSSSQDQPANKKPKE